MNNNSFAIETISSRIASEIDVINKCFSDGEESFETNDNYNKFILFSMYRGIEDCIEFLLVDRCQNGIAKKYCEIIKSKLVSNFIDDKFLELMISEIPDISSISYKDIMEYVNNKELSISQISINDVNEITNSKYRAEDIVDYSFFCERYKFCRSNRNKILHSVIKPAEYSRNAVIYSFIVYSYLMLVLAKIS